jgi:hypothetical protein
MNDDDITELAKGVAPFVRECVADAVSKAAMVPPELAAQVASAVRMLHEAPALEQRDVPRIPLRVARIERDEDGNFVPIYDETPS